MGEAFPHTAPGVIPHSCPLERHIELRISGAEMGLIKNCFMPSERISSYGCTREVWRARKKGKSCPRR